MAKLIVAMIFSLYGPRVDKRYHTAIDNRELLTKIITF
jgi:hypothetical protein